MDASQSRVHDHPSGVRCSPGCSARTAENSDPFLAAAVQSSAPAGGYLEHPVEIHEPEPEPPLPYLTVSVRERPFGVGGDRQVVEILLDGRPMGQLAATGVRWELHPARLGKLTIDLNASIGDVTAHV